MSDFFKHPQAIVETSAIGAGTRVWAFAHILPGAKIGRECNVCDGVFIENDVVVGDRVTIKCGVQLWDGVRLENDVFIGPNATFTNDPMPRSRRQPAKFSQTIVKQGASIGANATILPGLTIGAGSMVGAGAVVTGSVPPFAIVMGNPARIVRYVDADEPQGSPEVSPPERAVDVRVSGVQLFPAPIIQDLRGNLTAREMGQGLPFVPERFFVVFDVSSRQVRGEHAHRQCDQFLVALRGSVSVVCDDGKHRQEFLLDSPEVGLLLPHMVWGVQYKYAADAVLLVLASDAYDANDYIRDYDTFLSARKAFDHGCA